MPITPEERFQNLLQRIYSLGSQLGMNDQDLETYICQDKQVKSLEKLTIWDLYEIQARLNVAIEQLG